MIGTIHTLAGYAGRMNDRRLAVEAWESLFRAQHELFQCFLTDFEGELSQPEYDVLLTVTRGPDMTARLRDIVAKALISQPSVSRLVDRMVTRELVTKRPDPDDGRGSLITATELGAHLFRATATRHGRSIADRMAVLPPEELHTLLQITRRLRGTS